MLELELKAVVPDLDALRDRLEKAGATLTFIGRLEDRRYDLVNGSLSARDHALRLRVYRGADQLNGYLDWKGPTMVVDGYKQREELSTRIGDPETLRAMLERLGYVVVAAIDRSIWQYEFGGTTVRLERYPRMDDLVEVEGEPAAIERVIARLDIPRAEFNSDRLAEFARRYEERTGNSAEVADA